jgi:short-subunit dehydrogenase
VKTVALDLAAPDAPPLLVDQLEREGIAVDVLVNNAGYVTPTQSFPGASR